MSNDATNSNRKFEEALHLLNEAAREKKDEIQQLIGDKYSHIKDALGETSERGKANLNRLRKSAQIALEEGTERAREVASDLDEKVKENPWPYIGGAAAAALFVGYLLGASRK